MANTNFLTRNGFTVGNTTVFTIANSTSWTAGNTAISTTGIKFPDANVVTGIANNTNFYANTLAKALLVETVWSTSAFVTLTDGATVTVDFNTGANFILTLGGNRTMAGPTNGKAGQSGVILVKQDGTGSRTLSWNSAWKWSQGIAPTLTTTALMIDKIFYIVESASVIHASAEFNSK